MILHGINIILDTVENKYQLSWRIKTWNSPKWNIEIKDWKIWNSNDKWDNINKCRKYIIAIHKIKEAGEKKMFVEKKANIFLKLLTIMNSRSKNLN